MEEELIKRTLPYNAEAERSVIGSMIMDRDAIVAASEVITGDDFYQKQYGSMFDAIVELHNAGTPVDHVTLASKAKEKNLPPEYTEVSFIMELAAAVPSSVNVRHYAGIVREKSILRNLIKVTEGIANECYKGNDTLETILETTEKQVFQLLQNGSIGEEKTISSIALSAFESIQAAANTRGHVTGVPSGFRDLDMKTAGFQNSNLVLIAARPAMGKTAFVLNIAEHVAIKKRIPLVMFSLEMSGEELVKRILAMNARIDSTNMRTGNLQDDDWSRLAESTIQLSNAPIIIDDTGGLSITELRSKCRKYKLEHNIGLIIIDYLQLMSGGKRTESRQQEISEISRALKTLAKELNVPVIALSQLSRAVEGRPDKRPMLSDLRESGAIEQDADVVMFLYRDEYYMKDATTEPGVAEVIIGKQRSGPTGTVKLAWLAELTKFANLEHSDL